MATPVYHPLTRHDDGMYRTWADAQSDAWFEDELEEEEATQLALFDEVDELAIELAGAEGMPFTTAISVAEGMLPGLQAFAQDWDRHAWIGGNEGAKAF
jgi:hypothetical protein